MPYAPHLLPTHDRSTLRRPQPFGVERVGLRFVARLLLPVASLVTLVLLLGCAAKPLRSPAPSAPPHGVRLAQARLTRLPLTTEVVGTVRATRSATVAALISGTVAEVRIGLGTPVRAGDVLVRVSAREVEARFEQAHAQYTLALREGERASALHGQDVISKAQYDAAISQLTVAEAKQAEANTLAEHAVLRAPFAGVITVKRVNVGDTVLPGQTLLVLEAPSALRFEARVPEAAMGGLGIGDTLPIRLDGVDHPIDGRIAEIEPSSDDLTRTQLLRLDLPHLPRLQSGRFGRLLIARGESLAVTVPTGALLRQGQLEQVFVEEAGVARLRLVRTGRAEEGWQEVVSGLAGVERVIVAGADDLSDGRRVEGTE